MARAIRSNTRVDLIVLTTCIVLALAALATWCEESGVQLISDEIYHGIEYAQPHLARRLLHLAQAEGAVPADTRGARQALVERALRSSTAA